MKIELTVETAAAIIIIAFYGLIALCIVAITWG